VGEAIRGGFVARAAAGGVEHETALPDGNIDALYEEDGRLVVIGWMLLEEGPPESIAITSPNGSTEIATRVERPDLAAAFPAIAGADEAGFSAVLPAQAFVEGGEYELDIEATHRGETVFRRRIVRGRRGRPAPPTPPQVGADGVLRL
jgi:hypothetical protein